MKRSKALKHYHRLIDAYGMPAERREASASRPMGFQPPRSVTVGYIHPRGIETQAWEKWAGGTDE